MSIQVLKEKVFKKYTHLFIIVILFAYSGLWCKDCSFFKCVTALPTLRVSHKPCIITWKLFFNSWAEKAMRKCSQIHRFNLCVMCALVFTIFNCLFFSFYNKSFCSFLIKSCCFDSKETLFCFAFMWWLKLFLVSVETIVGID